MKIRNLVLGLGTLSVCVGLACCNENISDPAVMVGSTTTVPTDASTVNRNLTFPTKCEGQCCPTDATCYAGPNNGDGVGGECLATRDNTGQDHIQMRQAWIRTTTPKGNTDSLVYGALSGRSELPRPNCAQPKASLGNGGYIQIIDFFLGGSDKSKHYALLGYASFVSTANLDATLQNGFCFGQEEYAGDPTYRLPTSQMTNSDDFPKGLPKPMGLSDGPWHVAAARAHRLDADFDISDDTVRRGFLADLADDGKYGKDGFTGVFFYDDEKGYAHGYGKIGWTVVYGVDQKTHMSIPIREVETKSLFNDPKHPNCVGQFRADAMSPTSAVPCSSNDSKNPKWGNGSCGDHVCDPAKGEAPATIKGYFLITELEQIYSLDLLKTLCVSYPGNDDVDKAKTIVEEEGFYDSAIHACRGGKWDPTLPNNAGIPRGDWCAATNSPATDNCHDAWHSESLHVFVGGKIKMPADPQAPLETCPFAPTP